MILFMFYMTTLYLLQFMTLGSMFVTIIVFFEELFQVLLVQLGKGSNDDDSDEPTEAEALFKKMFFSLYLSTIFLTIFVSISMPINRAVAYFHVVSWILIILTLTTLAGICYYLSIQGFFPPVTEFKCVPVKGADDDCQWRKTGDHYFSTLCLAGVIMLTIYVLPMVMRPIDFLKNMKKYLIGFFSFMILMPVFLNVFQIYAMCNLHDVSWGNRPAGTGQEAFTAVKKQQAKSEEEYKVFRSNFVLLWLLVNLAYYILVIELQGIDGNSTYIDSDSGYLVGFSCVLAGLVLFRVIFAYIYICKWNCRYCCSSKYSVRKLNMQNEYKRIKDNAKNDEESTDDEEIEAQVKKIIESKKYELGENERDASVLHNKVLTLIKKEQDDIVKDDDYDFRDFENAEIEEAEDRIYSEYKRN